MKAPLLNLKSGKVDKVMESFRSMLMAEETGSTSSLRLGVTRQFAEVFTIYCETCILENRFQLGT